MKEVIIASLRESAELKLRIAKEQLGEIAEATRLVQKAIRGGGKILIFGNGGSAADAQHITAELVNRFKRTRRAIPAIALTTDTSLLTAISNDTSFSNVFSRQIEALGRPKDLAWGISTSGKSKNVIRALEVAKSMGLYTLVFTSRSGARISSVADCVIGVPSRSTPRIQEAHITIAHIICDLIEQCICEEEDEERT